MRHTENKDKIRPPKRHAPDLALNVSWTLLGGSPITQLEQVRTLIGEVLTEVVTQNNKAWKKKSAQRSLQDVLREVEIFFSQAKERQEEEHYRKLDSLIRQQQATRRRKEVKDSPC